MIVSLVLAMDLLWRISASLKQALGAESEAAECRQDLGRTRTQFWQVPISGRRHVPLLGKGELWTDLLILKVYRQMGHN